MIDNDLFIIGVSFIVLGPILTLLSHQMLDAIKNALKNESGFRIVFILLVELLNNLGSVIGFISGIVMTLIGIIILLVSFFEKIMLFT